MNCLPFLEHRKWEAVHDGNWSVLYSNGVYRLAPVYDNGSSLFEKRTDSVAAARIESSSEIEQDAFGTNTSAYLFVGEDGRAQHIHPYEYMSASSDDNLIDAMKRFCSHIDMDYINQLIASIPAEAYGWQVITQQKR